MSPAICLFLGRKTNWKVNADGAPLKPSLTQVNPHLKLREIQNNSFPLWHITQRPVNNMPDLEEGALPIMKGHISLFPSHGFVSVCCSLSSRLLEEDNTQRIATCLKLHFPEDPSWPPSHRHHGQ